MKIDEEYNKEYFGENGKYYRNIRKVNKLLKEKILF